MATPIARRKAGIRGIFRLSTLAGAVFVTAFFASCSRPVGWGVVLWSDGDSAVTKTDDVKTREADTRALGGEEQYVCDPGRAVELVNGQVIPVYVKSKIRKVYIVGLPSTKKKKGANVEVELWRIEFFASKSKATKFAKAFAADASLYALSTRDGLPVRKAPDPGSDRVYRMRAQEVAKVLSHVKGVTVQSGGKNLEGEWLGILTADGVRGHAFSNTLRLFNAKHENADAAAAAGDVVVDPQIETILNTTWRPAFFKAMIGSKVFDLRRFSLAYGLFVDRTRNEARLELPGVSKVFEYQETVFTRGGWLSFSGTALKARLVEKDGSLVIEYPGDNGEACNATLVKVADDVPGIVSAEESRRQDVLDALVARGSSFDSGAEGGRLDIERSGRISWKDRPQWTATADAPASGDDAGTIAFERGISPALSGEFDGLVTFNFDSAPSGTGTSFFYKFVGSELTLELVADDCFDADGLIAQRRALPRQSITFRQVQDN